MNLRLASAAACVGLAACATTAPPAAGPSPAPAANAAFRASDFQWSTAAGRGQVDGEVTHTENRVRYTCAAAGAVLTPETPWVRQRMMILYNSNEAAVLPADEVRRRTPPERSQDYSSFVKRATCDASGRFTFQSLPDGSWYVITVIRPADGRAGRELAAMRRVTIRNGRAVKVAI